MKLSFTTLGCPKWSLKKVIKNAAEMGFDGIELRGLLADMDITKLPEFTENLDSTRNLLAENNINVVSISTSARFAVVDTNASKQHFDETRRNMKLASELDASFVRVFGGEIPEGYTIKSIKPILVQNLKELGNEAKQYGVKIGLETHDSWTDSKVLAQLMEEVDHPDIGILWDLHHPYRFNKEQPEFTYSNLKPYIVGIHIKDSKLGINDEHQYTLLGEGDVPLKKMLQMIYQGGFNGYATLEWEKRWHPYLAEPEEAFPHFVMKMKEWMASYQLFS